LVYTIYEKKGSKINDYDVDLHIPCVNIDNEIAEKFNEEIKNVFVKIAQNVVQSENKNTIYSVEYVADIQDNILSIMIKSNLKEGSNAQKVIIQTYNYDLKTDKEVSLKDVIQKENIDEQKVQSIIKEEISNEQKKSKDLRALGYNIYNRDSSSDIYNIENSTEFYLTENTLYIIYAYGNETSTSEMDVVVI